MTAKPLTKREKSVRRHNLATLLALLSFVFIAIDSLELVALPLGVSAIVVLVLFASIITMFVTRNADEYTAALWRIGTSAAFVITASFILFLPFFEGMYDGFMGAHRGQDYDASDMSEVILMGSFFIANAWARLRGTV